MQLLVSLAGWGGMEIWAELAQPLSISLFLAVDKPSHFSLHSSAVMNLLVVVIHLGSKMCS